MRGPGLRVRNDVRRLWRCPQCGYERKAPATEVTVRCHCQKDEPWMKLVEAVRAVRPDPVPLDMYVNAEEALLEGDPDACVDDAVAEPVTEPIQVSESETSVLVVEVLEETVMKEVRSLTVEETPANDALPTDDQTPAPED